MKTKKICFDKKDIPLLGSCFYLLTIYILPTEKWPLNSHLHNHFQNQIQRKEFLSTTPTLKSHKGLGRTLKSFRPLPLGQSQSQVCNPKSSRRSLTKKCSPNSWTCPCRLGVWFEHCHHVTCPMVTSTTWWETDIGKGIRIQGRKWNSLHPLICSSI